MYLADTEDGYVPSSDLIAQQNDAFRKALCLGVTLDQPLLGRAVVTHAVNIEGEEFIRRAIAAVGTFEDFTPDNDPDGRHDFGAFDIDNTRLFWKIDLFEAGSQYRWGAERPDDPQQTERVLTIMLASDW